MGMDIGHRIEKGQKNVVGGHPDSDSDSQLVKPVSNP